MADTYEKDGVLYCSTCKEPLQYKYTLNGEERMVRVACGCVEKRRIQEKDQRNQALMRERIETAREAAFSDKRLFEYTFDSADDDSGIALVVAANYVEHFEELAKEGRGVMFYGSVGVGKTFFAACIANALVDKGYSVIFTNFATVASEMFGDKDKQKYLEKLIKCDLLVLDDLASERDTEYMGELVQQVIDKRYMNNKPIIVTTNLKIKDVKEPTNIRRERVCSRLVEMCFPVEISGVDRRRRKCSEDYERLRKILGA